MDGGPQGLGSSPGWEASARRAGALRAGTRGLARLELDPVELEHVELEHVELEHVELDPVELDHAELETRRMRIPRGASRGGTGQRRGGGCDEATEGQPCIGCARIVEWGSSGRERASGTRRIHARHPRAPFTGGGSIFRPLVRRDEGREGGSLRRHAPCREVPPPSYRPALGMCGD